MNKTGKKAAGDAALALARVMDGMGARRTTLVVAPPPQRPREGDVAVAIASRVVRSRHT